MACILIIDDDPDALSILATFLESEGHETHHASRGPEGLDVLVEAQPDLVILDVMMPGMDGLEVARRIRDKTSPDRPRILMLTARDDADSRTQALTAGADVYLVKPLSLKELAAQIRKVL